MTSSSLPYVLQFINTSLDVKDYYYLTSTSSSYQLRHYLANDDGVFNPECYVNEHGIYSEKVVEVLKHQTTDIRFLENSLKEEPDVTKSKSKVHVFLGPEFNFEGRYTRFIFHHHNKSRPPTHEPNKFVGVFLYAYADNHETQSTNTQQLLMLFKKNHNSLQSYETIGEFDPRVDDLPYFYLEKFASDGNTVDIYYYGERMPIGVDERLKPLLRTMPLALHVTNREVCNIHTTYQKSCILCVRADIMASPRQLTYGIHPKRDNSKANKNAAVDFEQYRDKTNRRRNYRHRGGDN